MKAMILAAGLGTRLRPLTANRPKALVEVGGRTLLEIALARLSSFGIREVIINVHHFAEMVVDYLKANDNFGMRVDISRKSCSIRAGASKRRLIFSCGIRLLLKSRSSCITSISSAPSTSGA